MLLEPVERHVRVEQRIVVVETNHESDRQLTVGHRIDEPASELVKLQRVAHRVRDRPGCDAPGRNLPQLLQSDGKLLRLTMSAKLQTTEEFLRQVAAHAIAEDGDLRLNVNSGFEGALVFTVTTDTTVARPHADYTSAVHQHVLTGEARENVDARRFDLLRQPLHERIERDDEVAVIPERWRDDRKRNLRSGGQEVAVVGQHRRRQRRALLLEVRNELAERRR